MDDLPEFEIYTAERKAELLLNNALDAEEYCDRDGETGR